MTFSATDNTGVRVRRLVKDGGTVLATATAPGPATGGCGTKNVGDAYTWPKPCEGARGLNGTLELPVADVCAWGDGEHAVRAQAEDTGGGTALSSPVTLRVDCTGPAVSVGPGTEAEVEIGRTVEPTVAAGDPRGVKSTEVQVQVGESAWQPYAGPVVASAGAVYRFRARATDGLGNVSAWSSPSAWTRAVRPDVVAEEPRRQEPSKPSHQDRRRDDLAPEPTMTTPTPPEEPRPPAGKPSAPTATARITAQRFDRRRRTLRITGTATTRGQVVLTIRERGARRVRTLTRRLRTKDGRFAATIRLRKGVRTARVTGIRLQPLR